MNILYIGSAGPLSLIPLQALIKSRHNVCALAFDDDLNSDFNVINSDSIQSLALNNLIPLIKLNKIYTNIVLQIRSYQPDVILVSCYAQLLPQSILSIARKGSFNIHPSLLPNFRGPNPLFWQFRDGVSEFGVTLHRMDDEFDTGDIVSQKTAEMQDGVTINKATELLAHTASDLVLNMLSDIENANVTEIPQYNLLASYQSFPVADDYTVSTLWSAKRIYNFINAYKGIDVSFLCEVDGSRFRLVDAYSYQEIPYKNMDGASVVLDGDKITLACKNSYIQCQIKIDR